MRAWLVFSSTPLTLRSQAQHGVSKDEGVQEAAAVLRAGVPRPSRRPGPRSGAPQDEGFEGSRRLSGRAPRSRALIPLLAGAVLALVGCKADLRVQPRYDPLGEGGLFRDGKVMQAPPTGALAVEENAGDAALATRPVLDAALLARGRERYGIYCSPCHGLAGDGHGIVPARGFPQPPDFAEERLKRAPTRHVVDVISNGYGVMYSYAARVSPADRWAVAAYVRALQLSAGIPLGELPAAERERLAPDAPHAGIEKERGDAG